MVSATGNRVDGLSQTKVEGRVPWGPGELPAQGSWQAGEQTLSLSPPESQGLRGGRGLHPPLQGPREDLQGPIPPHWGRETNESTYLSDRRQARHILSGARANRVTFHGNPRTTLICLFSRLVVSDSVTPWIAWDRLAL